MILVGGLFGWVLVLLLFCVLLVGYFGLVVWFVWLELVCLLVLVLVSVLGFVVFIVCFCLRGLNFGFCTNLVTLFLRSLNAIGLLIAVFVWFDGSWLIMGFVGLKFGGGLLLFVLMVDLLRICYDCLACLRG